MQVCLCVATAVMASSPLCSDFKLCAQFIKHDLFDQTCLNACKTSAKHTNATDYYLIVVAKWLISTMRV